jgi:hypothetical protein
MVFVLVALVRFLPAQNGIFLCNKVATSCFFATARSDAASQRYEFGAARKGLSHSPDGTGGCCE